MNYGILSFKGTVKEFRAFLQGLNYGLNQQNKVS